MREPIDTQFQRFHRNNPIVYETLVQLAYEARENGLRKVGINLLWEVMRWRMQIHTRGDPFKLNDIYRSRYARMLVENHPDLDGFFRMRRLRRL